MNEKQVREALVEAYMKGNEGMSELCEQEVDEIMKKLTANGVKKDATKTEEKSSGKRVKLGDLFAESQKK